MRDLEREIQDFQPGDYRGESLDVDGLLRRARRRRAVKRGSRNLMVITGCAVVLGVTGMAVSAGDWLRYLPLGSPQDDSAILLDEPTVPSVGETGHAEDPLIPPDDSSPDAEAPAAGRSDTPTSDEPGHSWGELSAEDALDRLMFFAEARDYPSLPPPEGQEAFYEDIYVTQTHEDDGTDTWLMQYVERIVDQDSEIERRVGHAAITAEPEQGLRETAIGLVDDKFDDMTTAVVDDSEVTFGAGWMGSKEREAHVTTLRDDLASQGVFDPEIVADLALYPDTGLGVLQALRDHSENVTYIDDTVDLLGRPAVGFAAGLRDVPDETAMILFSKETGVPVGWEYGGADDEWRLRITEVEVRERP